MVAGQGCTHLRTGQGGCGWGERLQEDGVWWRDCTSGHRHVHHFHSSYTIASLLPAPARSPSHHIHVALTPFVLRPRSRLRVRRRTQPGRSSGGGRSTTLGVCQFACDEVHRSRQRAWAGAGCVLHPVLRARWHAWRRRGACRARGGAMVAWDGVARWPAVVNTVRNTAQGSRGHMGPLPASTPNAPSPLPLTSRTCAAHPVAPSALLTESPFLSPHTHAPSGAWGMTAGALLGIPAAAVGVAAVTWCRRR